LPRNIPLLLMVRLIPSLRKFKRGIYQVYFVNPKHRKRSLPIWFDLSVLALLVVLVTLNLIF